MKDIVQKIMIEKEITYRVGENGHIPKVWNFLFCLNEKGNPSSHGEEGHRFFIVKSTQIGDFHGNVAVADQSADCDHVMGLPHETYTGVLWLDFGRPILIEEGNCLIPVIESQTGCSQYVIDRVVDAFRVSDEFGMKIMCGPYEVTEWRRAKHINNEA